jgi:hypothetical protein
MSDMSHPVTGSQTGRVSSPGRKLLAELISVTGLQPLNLALRGDVVKNGRKWILILATQYKINPEEYEVLDRLVGEFVSVHAIELGIHFTTTLLKRKGRGYIYVNIPARLKAFFEEAWREGGQLTVLVTIDPRLLGMNKTKHATNLKDGLRNVQR